MFEYSDSVSPEDTHREIDHHVTLGRVHPMQGDFLHQLVRSGSANYNKVRKYLHGNAMNLRNLEATKNPNRDPITKQHFNGRFSIAKSTYVDSEPSTIRDAIHHITGRRDIDEHDVGKLTGAPDHSILTMGVYRHYKSHRPHITITVDNPELGIEGHRELHRNDYGQIVMNNYFLHFKSAKQSKGIGARMLSHQVQHARNLGIGRIITSGARQDNDVYDVNNDGKRIKLAKKMIGYKVWPKLGYDGDLQDFHIDELPDPYNKALTVQGLRSMPGGADEWEHHGDDINLHFDTDPGSRSSQILKEYQRTRGIQI